MKLLSIMFFIILSAGQSYAQCNGAAPVVHYLSNTGSPTEIYRPNGSAWKGGDTVKITGTNYSVIEFFNVGGDECRDLVIMPQTTLTAGAIRFKGNSRHITIWGGNTLYGIKINGVLTIQKAHHITSDNIEITGGSVGVLARYDVDSADTDSWHPAYVVRKLTFKHLWIHDIAGEGMYLGTTLDKYNKKSPYTGNDTSFFAVRLDSVTVMNCIVERTGWDGIQLANARNGGYIAFNTVRDNGLLNISGQKAGIIVGTNTNAEIYSNTIKRAAGNAIQVFGFGHIPVHGNLIDSSGFSNEIPTGEQSIYGADYNNTSDINPKQEVEIYSNQINNPPLNGAILFYEVNNNAENINVHDNKFCIPNAPVNWQNVYLKLPATPINVNNVLFCVGATDPEGCNCILTDKSNGVFRRN